MGPFIIHRQQTRATVQKALLLLAILFLWLGLLKVQLCPSGDSNSWRDNSHKDTLKDMPSVTVYNAGKPSGVLAVSPDSEHRFQDPVQGGPFLTAIKGSHKPLSHLLSVVPDENQYESLLEPINATGSEKIHEVALRVRTFKALFEAWEDLHQIPEADGILSRDVIYSLYGDPGQPAFPGGLARIIHSYDTVHNTIVQLTSLLFPWVSPYSDLMSLHTQLYPPYRGIVITAGNKQAQYLLTMIPVIRNLGCTLPVEVMYLGDRDLDQTKRAELGLLPGVTTRDLTPMINDENWTLGGWAAKPFAILYSSFREIILIDADSLFMQNPETLFEDPEYQRTGALFFKDRFMMRGSKKDWLREILPRPISFKVKETRFWTGEGIHMQESGVVVVDKWKHFVALLMVARMNGPDRNTEGGDGVYDMVYGDKETYWLAWELVGDMGYAFHRGAVGILGPVAEAGPNDSVDGGVQGPDQLNSLRICGPQLLHLDLHDRPLWFNGWLLPNKFSDESLQPVEFEGFIKEPQTERDPEVWKLHGNNICCLKGDQVLEFRESEREVLQMTIDIWRDTYRS